MNRKLLGAVVAVIALTAIVGTAYALRKDSAETSTARSQGSQAADSTTDEQETDDHGQGRGRGRGGDGNSSQGSGTTTDPGSTTPASASAVKISDFAFSPAMITVKKGTTVTWTNSDSVEHTVTKDGTSGPDSDLLGQGETYSFTFNETGTFKYFCKPHPNMQGTVVVTE